MSIKYDIHYIENHRGSGKPQQFVNIQNKGVLSVRQLEKRMERSSSITASDAKAVFEEIRSQAVRELSHGSRLHIPGLGFLSLQAATVGPCEGDIKSDMIFVRNIKFRPEEQFLEEIRKNAKFEKSKYTTLSAPATDDVVEDYIVDYLQTNTNITTTKLRSLMGLSGYKARQHLARLTKEGVLQKFGNHNSPYWILAPIKIEKDSSSAD